MHMNSCNQAFICENDGIAIAILNMKDRKGSLKDFFMPNRTLDSQNLYTPLSLGIELMNSVVQPTSACS